MVQPLQIRETGAEGGHPQTLLWGELPPLEPSPAPTASPKEAKQHLVGPPFGRDSWGSNGPHIQDPWEAGPGQPSLGSASPHAVTSQVACTGQVHGEGAGEGRWREAECPHCCQHPRSGTPLMALVTPVGGWDWESQEPAQPGFRGSWSWHRITSPICGAAEEGPDQHPELAAPRAGSTQSARVLGPFQQPGEARPNAHPEPGRLSLGHPQPSAVAASLLASGWPWVQGTRREAPEAGRDQQTQGCSSLCPRPQAPGRD